MMLFGSAAMQRKRANRGPTMRKLLREFWGDEGGAVVTAEAALLATLGVAAVTAGGKMAAESVNDELRETARAMRSLDQSYWYQGFHSCTAATAGSCYRQPPVERVLPAERNAQRTPAADRPRPQKSDARPPTETDRKQSPPAD